MPVDDDAEDLAALEASPPPSPQQQTGEPEGPAAVAAAARSRIQQQRGDWYAAQQRTRPTPHMAVTPLFVSGGALHSTSTKNKEVILPPTLTRASDEGSGKGGEATPQQKQDQQQSQEGNVGAGQAAPDDAAPFSPDARICSRAVTEFSHLAVQKDGKTMSVLCLPWLYQKLHKDALLLGRGDQADIHTDHPSCSRAHCEIRRVRLPDGRCSYTLEDLNSAHGTLVNGGKIAPRKPTVLDDDDEVQLGFSQRLYTFKKGDDTLGLQRGEPSPSAATVTPPAPPPPGDGGDATAKPSFLQKHIEKRARMGGFSRGRGGGFHSGDRQRFQQGWGRDGRDSGDLGGFDEEDGMGRGGEWRARGSYPGNGGREGLSGAPYWQCSGNSGHEGSPDDHFYGSGERDIGRMRRQRGGWQQGPYSPTRAMDHGGEGYAGSRGAITGANATPLGGPWGTPAPYGGAGQGGAPGYPPAPSPTGEVYSPAQQPGGAAYPIGMPPVGGLYGDAILEAGGAYAAPVQPVPHPVSEPSHSSHTVKASFAKADRVYVHHIMLKFAGALNFSGEPEKTTLRDGTTPMQRTREQAKQYLDQARQLLQEQPEHFGDYAEELSDCASYKRRGEVGWLHSNGQLESGELLFPPLMAAGALALEIGQLSPVLESHMGFHLFLRTA